MPTYAWLARFRADFQRLTPAQQAAFLAAVTQFVEDLRTGEFRKGLEQGLAAHPEWDRVLHPERYLPASSPAPMPLPASPDRHATPSYTRP